MRVIFYLDDILLLASCHQVASRQTFLLKRKLMELGFTINLKKSELVPSNHFTYLGLDWDTTSMSVSLPEDKSSELRAAALRLLSSNNPTSRSIQQFLGKANFACIAVPRGRLRCRPLQRAIPCGAANLFRKVHLSPEAKDSLRWWAVLRETSSPSHSPSLP